MIQFTHRYKVWLMLEAETPISVGSGREGLTTDRLVARNASGVPYIPGTGLAGALRAALEDVSTNTDWENIWGDKTKKTQEKNGVKRNVTRGSRLIVNSAHLLLDDCITICEGLVSINEKSQLYRPIMDLPIRDHARLNDRGVAVDKGKFDEQVCFKGTRFVTSLELLGTAEDEKIFETILNQFASPIFRVGGGTRKGFGRLMVVKIYSENYNLEIEKERKSYMDTNNDLQLPEGCSWDNQKLKAPENNAYVQYLIELAPRDFFIFGAGYGDDEADDIYKTEKIIEWKDNKGKLSDEQILVPASSVKGALRHRMAFHYNKIKGKFINEDPSNTGDWLEKNMEEIRNMAEVPEGTMAESEWWDEKIREIESKQFSLHEKHKESKTDLAAQSEAVNVLFGYAADYTGDANKQGQRGNVIFSDIFLKKNDMDAREKIFDHVRIDRFTGGASDGALFQEKAIYSTNSFKLEIMVHKDALENTEIKDAWQNTLNDLCEGRLPLGGKTTKGHGYFTGIYTILPKLNQQ